MATPLEDQILSDFETRMAGSREIPEELAHELITLAGGDQVPSADALLATIKKNVGDQSV